MRILTIALFLFVFPALSSAQSPGSNGDRLRWDCLANEPGWIGLWLGDNYIGKLEPFEGLWQFRGKDSKAIAIREHVVRFNPPKASTGALPRNTPKVGVDETSPKVPASASPLPATAPKASKPADCKCGRECECMDGRRGGECTCGDGCKCALVNKHPPLPATAPKGGVEDIKGGGPDGRQLATPNFGVKRIDQATEQISISGRAGTRAEMMTAIAGPAPIAGPNGIPNDATKRRVTIISDSVAEALRAKSDFATAPELAYWNAQSIVQAYPRTAWQVTADKPEGRGFELSPNPQEATVYVQEANGKEVAHVPAYTTPQQMRGVLLDRDATYDARRDSFKGDESTVYLVGGGIVVVIAAIFLARYRKAQT
jgi:hypothetical protein